LITTKVCTSCLEEKPLEEYLLKNGYRMGACKPCTYKANKEWRITTGYDDRRNKSVKAYRRAQKDAAIAHLGGVCKCCGLSFHPAAMDFHHRDPKEKDIDPGLLMQRTQEVLFKELEKCDLLCANCHRILHYEETTNV